MSPEIDIQSKLANIRLFIADIDGVLTDGRIIFGNYGDELKFFDVHDGLGLVMLRRAGFKTIIITAKKSRINVKRAKEVQAVKLYQGAKDKLKVFEKVLKTFHVDPPQVCFIGDDLMDIPVLKRVGFAVAVQNAVQEVKETAHYVTQKNGGRGAVREVVDMILRAEDKWAEATVNYFR